MSDVPPVFGLTLGCARQGCCLMQSNTTVFLFPYSVLGPALTFRIGPNPKNVSTADLVQVAGEQSQFFLYYFFVARHAAALRP